MKQVTELKGRVASLDILRGFDMFLLLFFQPVLVHLGRVVDLPWLNDILYQFEHETWEGFRAWDMIMPLFMFMVGTSMPFSFAKFLNGNNRRALYIKILKRVALLYIFGMIVQGNLLSLDTHSIRLYSNTLQAIAAGYLIAAVILLNLSIRKQLMATLALMIIYWIPMTFCGDFTPENNFAEAVDRIVLGRFRDGVHWDDSGIWHFSEWYTYTWIWSSLTFGATVMLGAFAGQIIKRSTDKEHTSVMLALAGVICIVLGLVWGLQMPIIKRLWTSSMTLFAGGISFLLMAGFYFWIDYKGHSKGLNWLKIYGANAITAYVIGEVINFRSVVSSVSFGLQPILGDYYQVWLTFGNSMILFLILYYMYRQRIFLKL